MVISAELLVSAAVVAISYLLFLLSPFCWRRFKICQAAKKFPCPPTHWLWGNISQVQERNSIIDIASNFTNRKCFVLWLGRFNPVLSLIHPETIKMILKSSEPKILYQPDVVNSWLGNGLLFSEGHKWERNRKLLTPAFHFGILHGYISVYNECAETLIKKLEDLSKDGKSIEVSQYVTLATLEIVLRCAFSYSDKIQEKGSKDSYVATNRELIKNLLYRMHRPFLQYSDFLFKLTPVGREFFKQCAFVHSVADEVIQKRRHTLEENENNQRRRLDFLDILLKAKDENGQGLTDKEIRDEVNVFLFAGHDTTSSTLTFALYALAKYQDQQEKVWQEIQEVTRDRQEIMREDLPNLKYTHLFIREVLRTYSTVPFIGRELSKPYVFEGVECPKGMPITINIAGLNHNPKVWPDHKDFRPERFSTEARDPYAFVPFSAGPRNCIGQNFAIDELKVLITKLLKRFTITLDHDHEVVMVAEIVMKVKNGIKLFFHSRA